MIAATQMQILQSLFQHALQFIPEQSDPVDFFEMYFDETQIKKANGEIYNQVNKSNGSTLYNQGDSSEQQMQFTQGSNLGKPRFINQSQSTAGFGFNNDQNSQFQGVSKIGSKQDLNGQQSVQSGNGQVKKITVKKLQGSSSQQNMNSINDKDFKQAWKTKLSPIKQPKMQMIKLSKQNDPFNQHKDGFFHPPATAQSNQSGAYPMRGNNSISHSQNNTHYNNMNNVPSSKNIRSNSNTHYNDSLINGGQGANNNSYSYYKNHPPQSGYNAFNLDNSHNQPNHTTENQGHNQSQYSVYDPGFKYNPNPYAAGWANAILKEHYKVALKRIDEKNGRKRWIIRKIKMQKDGQDQHSSGINTHGENKGGGASTIVTGINQHHGGLIKPDNKLKKQLKKHENIEGVNDLFTNAFVIKQRELISLSQAELLDFAELIETLSFEREYIAYNLLNQPINDKLKNINEDEFEENLQPYHEYVAQNIFFLPCYHINFKRNLERVIFLNKLLIGNL